MIRRIFILFAAGLFGLFLQASVVHTTYPGAVAPDFILILVVLVALHFPGVGGLLGCFALGLLADFASGRYLGPGAGGAVVAFGVVQALASRMYVERGVALAFIAFGACAAKSLTMLGMLLLYPASGVVEVIWAEVAGRLVFEALLSAIFAPLVAWAIAASLVARGSGHRSGF